MKKNKFSFSKGFLISIIFFSFFKCVYSLALYLYNLSISRSDKTFLTKYIDLTDKEKELMDEDKNNKVINYWKEHTPSKLYNCSMKKFMYKKTFQTKRQYLYTDIVEVEM